MKYNKFTAEDDRISNARKALDPNAPGYKLELQRLNVAQHNNNRAAENAGIARFLPDTPDSWTRPAGTPPPGAMGNPVDGHYPRQNNAANNAAAAARQDNAANVAETAKTAGNSGSQKSSAAKRPLEDWAAPGDQWASDTETYQRGRYDGMQWNRTKDTETLTYKLPDGSYAKMTRANPRTAGQRQQPQAQPQQQPGLGYNADAAARYRDMVANGGLLSGRFGYPNTATNRGYTIEGSEQAKALFNRPVFRPGYTPRGGGETFRQLWMQEHMGPKPQQMPEAPQGGWQTRLGVYEAQMRNLAQQQQAALGYNAQVAADAREREANAQQYALGYGRLRNDMAQTSGQMGLNALQQQQLAQQMAQQDQINAVRERLANAQPGTPEYEEAQRAALAWGVVGNPDDGIETHIKEENGQLVAIQVNKKNGSVSSIPITEKANGIPSQDQINALLNSPQVPTETKKKIRKAQENGNQQEAVRLASEAYKWLQQ